MQHACEWETSMVMRIAPDLVHDHAKVASIDPGNSFLPAHRAWIIPDRSAAGHIGSPADATADKGEQLLALFADGLVHLTRRVIEWDGKSWDG
jgi:creatinine amidohydrolase